jgi:hypothetical protein
MFGKAFIDRLCELEVLKIASKTCPPKPEIFE